MVSLSVGYLCLDASWSVCVERRVVLFLSLDLFYPRDFTEVSGSEPSDSQKPCIAMIVVMIPLVVEASWFLLLDYDYFLLPPKAYSFIEAVPGSVISIFFQPPFPSEKVPPQCFISSSEPNSSHLPCLEQLSPCYSMGPSCPAPGFGTQPIHRLHINPPRKRTSTAFLEAEWVGNYLE